MRKDQIELRSGRGYRGPLPAINVKVYRWGCDASDVAERFQCSQATAEKACSYVFDSACQQFWEQAPEWAAELWPGYRLNVFSDGRSGGWLVVEGLPPVEEWDAIMVGKWARLARYCRDEIAYRFSRETIFDEIEANEWHKDGAELYNFFDRKDGTTVCIADLKRQAKDAGFGAIIR